MTGVLYFKLAKKNDGSMVNHSIEVRFVIFQFNIEVLEVGVNLDVLIFCIFQGHFVLISLSI